MLPNVYRDAKMDSENARQHTLVLCSTSGVLWKKLPHSLPAFY